LQGTSRRRRGCTRTELARPPRHPEDEAGHPGGMASRCFFPRDAAADARHQSKAAAAALEQLHHGGRLLSREDVGGAVRVKIVVSKRELKQMVAALGDGAGSARRRAPGRAPSRGCSRSGGAACGGRPRRRAGCRRAGSGSPACRASPRRSTDRRRSASRRTDG